MNESKPLTKSVKIAMLKALQTGNLSIDNEAEIKAFLGLEPITLAFYGTRDEYNETINSVQALTE